MRVAPDGPMKKQPKSKSGHKSKSRSRLKSTPKSRTKSEPRSEPKPEFKSGPKSGSKWHVSLADLVEFYNAPHDSTIRGQIKIEGFPEDCKIKHGVYNLKKYNDWRIDHFYGDENISTTMAAEKLRYQIAKSNREENRDKKEQGNLLDREQLLQSFSIILTGLRNRFLGWYKTQPPMLISKNEKEMGMILRLETRALLADLAGGVKSILSQKKRKKKK